MKQKTTRTFYYDSVNPNFPVPAEAPLYNNYDSTTELNADNNKLNASVAYIAGGLRLHITQNMDRKSNTTTREFSRAVKEIYYETDSLKPGWLHIDLSTRIDNRQIKKILRYLNSSKKFLHSNTSYRWGYFKTKNYFALGPRSKNLSVVVNETIRKKIKIVN